MTSRNAKILVVCVAALVAAFIAAGIGVISGRPDREPPPAADQASDEQPANGVSRAMTFTQPQAPTQTTAPTAPRAATP